MNNFTNKEVNIAIYTSSDKHLYDILSGKPNDTVANFCYDALKYVHSSKKDTGIPFNP